MGERLFEHDHREDACAGADVAGARRNRIGRGHAGAGVALGRAEPRAGLQRAGRVQQFGALGGQRAGVGPGKQHLRQQGFELHRVAGLGRHCIKGCKHRGVVIPGGRIDREHPRSIPNAEDFLPGQLPVDIAGQRREEGQAGQVFFAVEHRLVEVRDAPPLRNVEMQGRGQRFGGGAGDGVAPGAERHQQAAGFIKRQVPVHHGRNANAADIGKRCAEFGLHIGRQRGPGRLYAAPDIGFGIGPNAVFKPVFPHMVTLGQRGMVRPEQHRFDPGGAQLQPDRAARRVKCRSHCNSLPFLKELRVESLDVVRPCRQSALSKRKTL